MILGAVLLDNAVIAQAVEHLKPEDFYSPLNRRVFAAMIALFEKQRQIDPILIGEELKKGRLARVDRRRYCYNESHVRPAAFFERGGIHKGRP